MKNKAPKGKIDIFLPGETQPLEDDGPVISRRRKWIAAIAMALLAMSAIISLFVPIVITWWRGVS